MAEGMHLAAVRGSGNWYPQVIKGKRHLVCSEPQKSYRDEP